MSWVAKNSQNRVPVTMKKPTMAVPTIASRCVLNLRHINRHCDAM